MNRLQRGSLGSIILPALAAGLIGAGLTILVNIRLDLLSCAAGFCFGFVSILGFMVFEGVIKDASLGKLPLWLEIIGATIVETGFILAIFDTTRTAFTAEINGSPLFNLLQTLDLIPAIIILACGLLILQYFIATATMLGRRTFWRYLSGHYRNPR